MLLHAAHAEDGAEKPLSLQTQQQPPARFVQPPDPSSLPAALPLPPDRTGSGSLDLLPSFPPLPPERPGANPSFAIPLDLVIKKREDPSLVPDGPNPTEDAAIALSQRHRFQIARVKAMNEPEVQEALSAAQRARTDREMREAMRRHYTLLFSKMRKADASLETLIREREAVALKPLQEWPRPAAAAAKN